MDIICIIGDGLVTFFSMASKPDIYNQYNIFILFYLFPILFTMQDICENAEILRCENYTLSYILNDQGLKFILQYLDTKKPNKVVKTMEGYLPNLISE